MSSATTKIIIIHDGLFTEAKDKAKDPLIVELEEKFPTNEIIHFENSDNGLKYVLQNVNQKMIILLDINFSKEELSGIQVFEKIRKETALIYIILITAKEIQTIKNEDLLLLINHDAFALENVTSDYTKIISIIVQANHKLDTRVDSALQYWISQHSENEKSEPYLSTRNGTTYTLNQILSEIQSQTPFGMEIEKEILLLAIDMLSRGKRKING